MKIYSMTATFGKLEHATLTLQPGLNIVQAPNEWGKSTWCAFLSAMLYGIDTRERTTAAALAVKERYAPWSGAPMRGRMDLSWNGRDITIERDAKGRTPFADFRAYETASGIPVPELTADNCGKLLLGVEKSVYQRTGFIRFSDMPVTQDEALRRRLNELVTTGDESGQSDDLAQKLRDLKNKVRSNRSNGLIPQAFAEKTALEQKLSQLSHLQTQTQQAKLRQQQVAEFTAQLHTHKAALQYTAARERAEKTADARRKLAAATAETEALERICQNLPTEEALMAQAQQARQLQARKDTLQLDLAMLTAPAAPQGLTPLDPEQAKKDFDTYQALSAVTPPAKGLKIAAILALILALAGMGLMFATMNMELLMMPIIGAVILAVFGFVAAWCGRTYRLNHRNYTETRQQLQELTGRYGVLPAEQWVSSAENYVNQNNAHQAALSAHEAERTRLQTALQQVCAQLAALPATDGHDAALQQRRALQDARREQQHLQRLVQTLEDAGPLPPAPAEADSLSYSEADTNRLLSDAEAEARQLHKHLGQLEGQMLSLGSREALEGQLAQVSARLTQLERTYAALELAQCKLSEAATALQRRFAPAIAKKAQAYFSQITDGRYDRVQLGSDMSLHTAARDEDTLTSSMWRSDGTADQLYLALRLAVSDALTPDAPLVLDDALVRFDDTRLAETMALLKNASCSKQVILFTCQTRESQHA